MAKIEITIRDVDLEEAIDALCWLGGRTEFRPVNGTPLNATPKPQFARGVVIGFVRRTIQEYRTYLKSVTPDTGSNPDDMIT